MNDYERALHAARQTSVIMPEFEAIAAASDRDREQWTDEDHDIRVRARRWLLFAAAVYLFVLPPLAILESKVRWREALNEYLFALPFVLALLWAARLSQDRRLRSAILTRAIATSCLVFALLISLSGIDSGCIVSVLLAVALGRSLQLLGEHGLGGSEDTDSSFEPVEFRGILILALVVACADVSSLIWTATITSAHLASSYLFGGYDLWPTVVPNIAMTTAAAALMIVNVWGLLRLRTWALISNMFTSVGIAALALAEMLLTGVGLTIALVVTAGIQLALPLPILATALGWDGARRYEWVWLVVLRVVVPATVLATIASAMIHFLNP